MPDTENETEADAVEESTFVPNPTDVYGHINLRDIGDQHLVQQTPVFAQARALALDPEANLADVKDSGPNIAGFDLTADEPVTVLDGEAIADRQAEERVQDQERRDNLAAAQGTIDNPGTGPSAAGVRPGQNADEDDKEGVRGAAKKVASKVAHPRGGAADKDKADKDC